MGTYSRLNRPIIVVAYDPKWPALYDEEKSRILAALAKREACLEHFGSTSIPGLAAKPVIDIAMGIQQLDQASQYITVLESLGYVYMPELEAELPERRFLWRVAPGGQRYHISLTEIHRPVWEQPLAFRDYLRLHPEAAAEYGKLKEKLAAQSGSDIGAYIYGKTEFVERILQAANTQVKD